jgi:hypothetical protein
MSEGEHLASGMPLEKERRHIETHTRADASGPLLADYIELRFGLLDESLREKLSASHAALLAADIRYQQRFEAQSDALAAAFLSQQTAMQTAFVVAEKAVQAALAAADRAVSKAELASDKRFEALNELRQMLNDMVANLIPRPEATQRFDAMGEKIDSHERSTAEKVGSNAKRIEDIESRLSALGGEAIGGRQKKDDTKSLVAMGVAVLAVLLTLFSVFRTTAAAPQVIYVPSPPGTMLPTSPPATVPR